MSYVLFAKGPYNDKKVITLPDHISDYLKQHIKPLPTVQGTSRFGPYGPYGPANQLSAFSCIIILSSAGYVALLIFESCDIMGIKPGLIPGPSPVLGTLPQGWLWYIIFLLHTDTGENPWSNFSCNLVDFSTFIYWTSSWGCVHSCVAEDRWVGPPLWHSHYLCVCIYTGIPLWREMKGQYAWSMFCCMVLGLEYQLCYHYDPK